MFSTDDLNSLAGDIFDRLSGKQPCTDEVQKSNENCSGKNKNNNNNNNKNNKIKITPSQALVIAGLLGGALTVNSVTVDKDQAVEIVLTGTLKQKTELEKMMDQIGTMPFDQVVKAMLNRL